jgi:hypothetical protein
MIVSGLIGNDFISLELETKIDVDISLDETINIHGKRPKAK